VYVYTAAAPLPTPERMTAILGRVHEVLAAAGHDADELDLEPALSLRGPRRNRIAAASELPTG